MVDKTTGAFSEDDDLLFTEADGYDPLFEEEEKDADEIAETFGYIGDPAELAPRTELEEVPLAPASERIEALFENMLPYKRSFLEFLDFCKEPRGEVDVQVFIDGLRAKRKSVYTGEMICEMLERAGALEKLTETGLPYQDVEPQLEEVEEDGVVKLRPVPAPPAQWRTTFAGLEALEKDDPTGVLREIIAEHERFTSVFREILELCAQEGGVSINDLKAQVNQNPVLEYPRKSAQYFMDYLDRNGAIAWSGSAWVITSVGEQILSDLLV